ncbi:MAG: hypothetical protein L3J35_08770 [Bacteroidales bacterium]|nr:hypothetical protein [Bacteroidales bacterium]
MKNIKILSIFLMLVIVFAGCKKKDDFTGHSQLTPTNPTITVDLGTITAANDGTESSHTITLNMDVAQIVDVAVHILVLEGTATEDVDFSLSTKTVMIPAGKTTASFTVNFLTDDEFEPTETFKIQIGDDRTANAAITPVTADFTIVNAVSDDLVVGMSWSSAKEVYDVSGALISATDLADLILSVTDDAGNEIYSSDGGSFEEVTMIAADVPDGLYYVTVAFYSAMDLGDQGDVDLNISLDFMQSGVFTATNDFPSFFSISTATTCSEGFRLMEITKSGTTWTLAEYVDPLDAFIGSYGGVDDYISAYWSNNPSEIYTTVCGTDLLLHKINTRFMEDIWSETVVSYAPLVITLNPDNTISIADQYCMTTDYNGTLYDYDIINVSGTWTAEGVLHIEYEMDQGGFWVAAALQSWGYGANDFFEADVTIGTKNLVSVNTNNKPIERKKIQ